MKLIEPIDIDLFAFIKMGEFGCIKLGQTKEWILNNFPDPDEIHKDNYDSPIWFYGNIEFHFYDNETLFLIYSDYMDTLTGGQSLRLRKWIFDEPEKLTIKNIIRHLAKERIAFELKYGTLSNGYVSAAIEITASKVKLSFTLAENDEEDYEQYLQRFKSADSNLFLLFSLGLMTQ